MLSEYVSASGARAITDKDDTILPTGMGAWVRRGQATVVTYADMKIIERDGFVLLVNGDA